ncbi:hypothetical protein P152DRAFT_476061 [Eremomyces bilateralis CBS 781.70]|uniref:Mitochondrial export translocase Oxa2 n=1 Tax=Eremomyces bilateralis CBS 781.70 TaxID=1392243 RepID=A0A6G1FVX9_9PEZI|nr:uncharacterized protein P152DRAFT_476061 [Eremomyces bilateralis CBS 781.70]KAF1809933.1 hypothetical protein P152DRAFT_476061 [Eremomyces bilateralis CBS 781.70]
MALSRPLFRLGTTHRVSPPQLIFTHPSPRLQNDARQFIRSPGSRHIASNPTVEKVVDVFTEWFHLFHDAHLSWAFAIPVAAVTLRCLTFAALNIPARRHALRFSLMRPMLHSNFAITERIVSQRRDLTARAKTNLVRSTNANNRKRLSKTFRWKPWTAVLPFVQFPIFLAVAESLRRMAGRGSFLFDSVPSQSSGTIADTTIQATSTAGINSVTQWLEPSFHTEGILWFTDLCVPDPLLVLPATITIVNLLEVFLRSKQPTEAPVLGQEPTLRQRLLSRKVIRRMLIIFSFAYFPVSSLFPAAVQLYWISSTLTTATSYRLLEKYMPETKVVPRPKWPYHEDRTPPKGRKILS